MHRPAVATARRHAANLRDASADQGRGASAAPAGQSRRAPRRRPRDLRGDVRCPALLAPDDRGPDLHLRGRTPRRFPPHRRSHRLRPAWRRRSGPGRRCRRDRLRRPPGPALGCGGRGLCLQSDPAFAIPAGSAQPSRSPQDPRRRRSGGIRGRDQSEPRLSQWIVDVLTWCSGFARGRLARYPRFSPRSGGRSAALARAGETVVQIVPSSPDSNRSQTYVSVLAGVRFARRTVFVTMAYFIPDERLEKELMDAARRGVEVRLVLPSFSDAAAAFYAGRSHYDRLLAAGVRIHEHESAFVHAKTAVIDGIWSTVGSTNWDLRSFVHNDEVSIVVIDEGFAARMERLFRKDLALSSEVTHAKWRARGPGQRFLEGFWSLFSRSL
ncbi:MAG: phospholipase D-like domain-containing protein [Myxococcota bacterium]